MPAGRRCGGLLGLFPSYKSLINSSGLFNPSSPILSPVEAGPHASWRGIDGPHCIYCALHSWGGFPDLCAVSVDLGRQAPRHSSPSGGAQESARGAAAPAIPCPFTKARSRRPAHSKRRCEAKPSRSTQIRDLTDECCGGPGHAAIGKKPRIRREDSGVSDKCRGRRGRERPGRATPLTPVPVLRPHLRCR